MLTIITILVVLVLIVGALNFPYVPMFFGVVDGKSGSAKDRLILKLIWLYPVVALFSLVLAWSVSGIFSLVPLIYIFFLWVIRENKDNGARPVRQSQSQSENLNLRSKEADYEWANSGGEGMQNTYVLFTVLAPSSIAVTTMSEVFNKTESLYSDIEIKSYENDSSTLGVRIILKPSTKDLVDTLLNRVVEVAWTNGGELLSINILNSDT